MAPRRKRSAAAPSSSAALPDDFDAAEAMLHFSSSAQQDRCNRLRSKDFGVFRVIDWNVLASIGQDVAVRCCNYTLGWASLFAISETAYFELTVEFFSSFDFRWAGADNLIEFRMGGVEHSLTLRRFNTIMDFCDEDFTLTDDYVNLSLDFPTDFSLQAFWAEISNDPQPYSPKKSKGSHLLSPALRYLHYLLTYSLSARGDSHGVVTRTDLLYLYSLHRQIPLNLGSSLALFFRHQAENKRLSALHGGAFVTSLAKRLGIWDALPPLHAIRAPEPITFLNLRALGLARRRGQDYEVVPGEVVGDAINLDFDANLDDTPTTAQFPPPPQQHFPPATSSPAYFDHQFGRLHTHLDQLQSDQLSMHAHFDSRFDTLEQHHASSMAHLQREFGDLRAYIQERDDVDGDND